MTDQSRVKLVSAAVAMVAAFFFAGCGPAGPSEAELERQERRGRRQNWRRRKWRKRGAGATQRREESREGSRVEQAAVAGQKQPEQEMEDSGERSSVSCRKNRRQKSGCGRLPGEEGDDRDDFR